jgi:hypothetical protein
MGKQDPQRQEQQPRTPLGRIPLVEYAQISQARTDKLYFGSEPGKKWRLRYSTKAESEGLPTTHEGRPVRYISFVNIIGKSFQVYQFMSFDSADPDELDAMNDHEIFTFFKSTMARYFA